MTFEDFLWFSLCAAFALAEIVVLLVCAGMGWMAIREILKDIGRPRAR